MTQQISALRMTRFTPPRVRPRAGAFTLVEAVVGMSIFILVLAGVPIAGSRMTGLLEAQREVATASQLIQERTEQIRRTSFPSLTDSAYVQNNLLDTPTNSEAMLHDAVEVLTVSAYPPDGSPSLQETRQGGAVTVDSDNPALGASAVVRLDYQLSWLSQRGTTRTKEISTIVAKGGIND